MLLVERCDLAILKTIIIIIIIITETNGAFTLGRLSLDKSLYMRPKTLLATLFNESVHTSHMWSDLSSDMRRRMWTMCPRMCPCFSMESFTLILQCTFMPRTKYRRCRTCRLCRHKCVPSALTLGHMCADKSFDASSDLRPSLKALQHTNHTIHY